VVGGLFVVWLPNFAEKASGVHIGSLSFAGKPDIFYGAALILIMLFAPNGAAGLMLRGWRWYLSMRSASRLPAPGPVANR
jgi:ABC-type branched-subunit amino acid transport system permease subunit